MPGFADLGVKKWLVDQLAAVAIKEATPVQEHCIPEILKGKEMTIKITQRMTWYHAFGLSLLPRRKRTQ